MLVKDGKLDGELLMDQPQGFMFQELSHHGCLLKKTLYGSALMHDFVKNAEDKFFSSQKSLR